MNHPIENIMQTSMEHIKKLVDVNTVIGSPLMAGEDTMILPVSRVSLGMLVGGGEYLAVAAPQKSRVDISCEGNYPFIGTSALGMSLTPLAFLAVQNDSVRVLPAKQDCAAERLIDLIPQAIETVERMIKDCSENGCDTKREQAPKPASRRFSNGVRIEFEAPAAEGENRAYGHEEGEAE